ncbi:hypothetical protein [Microbacterium esteraromaticum]|uniref:hypothetical protein n=1 Tax=Microbacterium esteraromaticum TaxID=57043 RepID=UPI001C94D0E1|nr:hypothetical protein [Microbacterium esteraromaticum]MBY6062212.1 hypothetical protein [Microbacterium esteraromaticum]
MTIEPQVPDDTNSHDSAQERDELAWESQFPGASQGRSSKRSVSQQLVDLARSDFTFGLDQNEKSFGVRKGHHTAHYVSGGARSVRQQIAKKFNHLTGKVASQTALTELVSVLEFECAEKEPTKTYLRGARIGSGEILIDLGDRKEHVVRVTADGWEVLGADAPIDALFRRTKLTGSLPVPERSGDLDLLWKHVNMPSIADQQVLKGWLVATHILQGLPCPILAVLGEQGTAKTSSARCAVALTDPSPAPIRRPPNDVNKLLHAVHGSRVTAFDNLSSIPKSISDAMCRVVTGESDVDRSLYSDDDLRVISVQGVLVFTGIDVGALNGDLAERCVWANLEVIPPTARRSESELQEEWKKDYPSIFGGLLDLLVQTLAQLPNVNLPERPRMADFAEVLAAIDLATGSKVLERYWRSQEAVASDIVETDDFLIAIAEKIRSRWTGTAKQLHSVLPARDGDKYWPTARGMNGKLKRVGPDLRKAGWTVVETKADPASKRAAMWTLEPPPAPGSGPQVAPSAGASHSTASHGTRNAAPVELLRVTPGNQPGSPPTVEVHPISPTS